MAIVLEARKIVGIKSLWSSELELLLFGCNLSKTMGQNYGKEDPRYEIDNILEQIQLCIYGEIKSKKRQSEQVNREP